jgi:inhibitor of cysteine peptidase
MSQHRAGYGFVLLMVAALGLTFGRADVTRAQPRVVAIAEGQNGTTTTIGKDQILEIRLPTQAGTGYSWALAAGPTAPLKLARSDTTSADRPGASQTQIFMLQPTNTGAGDLVINYSRPWEKDKPPARTFTLHVVVR